MRSLSLCLFLLISSLAIAEQSDPRLDQLFGKLKLTHNAAEAEELTQQIWSIWYFSERPQAEGLMQQGINAMSSAQYQQALSYFDELINLYPDFAEAWNRRATLYYILGKHTASIDDIKHTLLLEPRHFGAIVGLGLIYLQENQLEKARDAFKAALEINPFLDGAKQNIETIEKRLQKKAI